jgi:hypothetical protein
MVREEEAAGGVQYAATASPSYYGMRLLHTFLHPDLVPRLENGQCAPPGRRALQVRSHSSLVCTFCRHSRFEFDV